MTESCEWTTIPYKRHRRGKQKLDKQPTLPSLMADCNDDKTYSCDDIHNLTISLLDTKFCQKTLEKISQAMKFKQQKDKHFCFGEVICYGLGRPAYNKISALQLAFLRILSSFVSKFYKENLANWPAIKDDIIKGICAEKQNPGTNMKCLLFDPAFGKVDKALIKDLGFVTMETNELAKRESHKSLFYMIHCDKWMYNNLLWKNWSTDGLENCFIVGNSFRSMYENTPTRIYKTDFKYLYLIVEHSCLKEYTLPVWQENDVVFNDTSIIVFTPKDLTKIDFIGTWDKVCPLYEE